MDTAAYILSKYTSYKNDNTVTYERILLQREFRRCIDVWRDRSNYNHKLNEYKKLLENKSKKESTSSLPPRMQVEPKFTEPNPRPIITQPNSSSKDSRLSVDRMTRIATGHPLLDGIKVDEAPIKKCPNPTTSDGSYFKGSYFPDGNDGIQIGNSEEMASIDEVSKTESSSDECSKDWDIVGVDSEDMDLSTTSLSHPARTKSKSTLDLNQEFSLPYCPQTMDTSLSKNMAQLSIHHHNIGCKYETRTSKRQQHDFGFEYGLRKFKSTGDLTFMELPKLSWQTSISLDTFEFMRNSFAKWRLNDAQRIYTAMNPDNSYSCGARLPSIGHTDYVSGGRYPQGHHNTRQDPNDGGPPPMQQGYSVLPPDNNIQICVTLKSEQYRCFCLYCPVADFNQRILSANQLYSQNRLCLDECCKYLISQPSQHNQSNAFAPNFPASMYSTSNAMPYNQRPPPPEQQHLSPSQAHLSNSGQYFPASCNPAAYNPPMTPQYNPTYPSSSSQIGYSQSHQQASNTPSRISNGLPNQNPEFNNPNMTMKLPPNNHLPSTSSSNSSTTMVEKMDTILSTPPDQQIKKQSRGQKDPVEQKKKRGHEKNCRERKKTAVAQTLVNTNLILDELHENTRSNQEIQKCFQEMQKSIQEMQKSIQEVFFLFKAYIQQNPMLSTPNSQQTHTTTTTENLGPSTSQLNMQTSQGEYTLMDVNFLSTQDQRPEVHVPDYGHLSEEFTLVASHPNASNVDSSVSKNTDLLDL